jgi:hypothetical protein
LTLNSADDGKENEKGDRNAMRRGSSPPAEGITNVDNENSVGTNDQTCIEENTNFAGSGIKDNRIDEIFSPVDCQKKMPSKR